ncbi:2762_t:CDS:2 [Ambispora leptoticha]|uniref:2762_t:CDS:1 n=1 Tax=Ambispora leptoticha TaxID=144679 RepID=A0A9N9EFW5_9GLOM|nr:2762_t:CDS:2 [Ambispora leptoticha]
MNSNEPAPTVEEDQHPLSNKFELNGSEKQVPPENSNNSSSQNVTQNAIKRIYINLEEPDYDNEEAFDYDNEELNNDNIQPNIMENQAEIRRRIHLYSQICPQTGEEREYSPSPHEGFTTDLDKDTIVICSRCNHGMENGMCVLYCGYVVCGDCGTLYKKDRFLSVESAKNILRKTKLLDFSFNYLIY